MRLSSFSVENYRSITTAKQINTSNSTVLVGPNNEGKSNLVKGLTIAMQFISGGSFAPIASAVLLPSSVKLRTGYVWDRDFPMHLQEKHPGGTSTFVLDFELNAEEAAQFKEQIGNSISGHLTIKISLGQSNGRLEVLKQGRVWKTVAKKLSAIAKFIRDRATVEYIPAVRTAESAQRVVQSLLEGELSVLEKDPAYTAALKTISDLQKPILDQLSRSVKETMIKFLPVIKDVKFKIQETERFRALRRSTAVVVDDGTPTELNYKGDGVQSLAALALMRSCLGKFGCRKRSS